jgi:hypothetical protein
LTTIARNNVIFNGFFWPVKVKLFLMFFLAAKNTIIFCGIFLCRNYCYQFSLAILMLLPKLYWLPKLTWIYFQRLGPRAGSGVWDWPGRAWAAAVACGSSGLWRRRWNKIWSARAWV